MLPTPIAEPMQDSINPALEPNVSLLFCRSVFCLLSACYIPICFAEDYKFSDVLGLNFETERLILTPSTDDYLEILSEYLLDSDVTKYLDPSIESGFKTREEALLFLKSDGACSKSIELTIKLKDSKLPIGKLDAMLFGDSFVSFGYWIGKGFQRKGFASEACYNVCNKVPNASDIQIVYIACDSRNNASAQLASKVLAYLEQNNKLLRLNRHQGTVNVGTQLHEFVLRKVITK